MASIDLFLQPAGSFVHDISGVQSARDLVRPFWSRAESFGVVKHVAARVDLTQTGQKKQRATRKDLRVLPVSADRCTPYWVTEWPGTVTDGADVVLVTGKLSDAEFDEFFPSGLSPMWTGFDGWEDLFLFTGDRLHFFCCSHEEFGGAYGPDEVVAGSRSELLQLREGFRGFAVRGDSIDSETWSHLTADSD